MSEISGLEAVPPASVAPASPAAAKGRRGLLRGNGLLLAGVTILVFVLILTVTAPLHLPHDPLKADLADQLLAPGREHWFGTDESGFDVYSRVVYGARFDLLIALIGVGVALLIGVPLGLLAGFRGGVIDTSISRALDVFQAFPLLVLAIAVLAALGRGVLVTGIVIGLVSAPTFVRLVREETRTLRERAYVEAARCLGFSRMGIVRRYVFPGTLGLIFTQAATSCAWAILMAASLGFLGLGMPVPTPEWGYMISTGADGLVSGVWWTSVFPGLAIVIVAIAFTLIGEGLSRLSDPRRRRAR